MTMLQAIFLLAAAAAGAGLLVLWNHYMPMAQDAGDDEDLPWAERGRKAQAFPSPKKGDIEWGSSRWPRKNARMITNGSMEYLHRNGVPRAWAGTGTTEQKVGGAPGD
jgi:hypothetical protein